MKWIVFWILISTVLAPYKPVKDEFGRGGEGLVSVPAVLSVMSKKDTLHREFDRRDSAYAFMNRAKKEIVTSNKGFYSNLGEQRIDTVWMEVRFANETDDPKFENFKEEVGFHYSEEFWNWIADCSDAINDQPYYNIIIHNCYYKRKSVKTTTHYIEHLYRTEYEKCLKSVGGKDIELPDGSQYCFAKIFGSDRK